jgi:hypothetical protein
MSKAGRGALHSVRCGRVLFAFDRQQGETANYTDEGCEQNCLDYAHNLTPLCAECVRDGFVASGFGAQISTKLLILLW